jgi:hypothetical protein
MNNQDQHLRDQQIELLLRWEGRVSNSRLRELFGLSTVRASEWIREYRERHPGWLLADSKTKSFFPSNEFHQQLKEPARGFLTRDLARYQLLAGVSYACPVGQEAGVVWVANPDLSTPNPIVYSILLSAARDKAVVSISYRSMNNPQPHQRTISPHSLVRVGRRWHVRAYCDEVEDFRDFTFGRIVSAKVLPDRKAERVEADDSEWMRTVKVRVVAHPALSADQAGAIRFEYFNGTSALVETCRAALANYFIQDIRAATDVTKQVPPDFQLAVDNVDEIRPWLFPN